mgnify:CR=1 FL=1
MLKLTKREKNFFSLLLKHQNKVVETSLVKKTIWEEELNDERLRTFIKILRLRTSKDLKKTA